MSSIALSAIAHRTTLRELAEAMRTLSIVSIECGTVLAEQGLQADPNLVHVLTGELESVAGAVALRRSPAGATVGQETVFGAGAWGATVTATQPSVLLVAPAEVYDRLRRTGNPIASAFERGALADQIALLRDLDDRIGAMATGGVLHVRRPGASFFRRFRRGGGAVSPEVGVTALRSSPLFQDAHPDAVRSIAEHMSAHRYRAGELIAAQGDPSDLMYFLAEGQVDVLVSTTEQHHEPVGVLTAGTVFGMTSLLEQRPRIASLVARERVLLYGLGREQCLHLVESNGSAGSALRRALLRALVAQTGAAVEQVGRLDAWVKEQVHDDVTEHLYRSRALLRDGADGSEASRLGSGGLVLPR